MSSMPPHQMLCGDEIQAAVIDIGSCLSKFGTAGQDLPRHIFKSAIGISDNSQKNLVGDICLRHVASNIEIITPFKESRQNLYSHIESLMSYGLIHSMNIDLKEYPLMFAEGAIGETTAEKCKILDLSFEKFGSPAVYFASNASLSSFSSGRSTSLVVDIGASGTTISPVIDGYVMKRATVKSSRKAGGDYLDQCVYNELMSPSNATTYSSHLNPWFEVSGACTAYSACTVSRPSSSFRQYHVNEMVRDIKQWMCFVPYSPIPENTREQYFASTFHMPAYELPDGTLIECSEKLCTIPESMFIDSSSSNKRTLEGDTGNKGDSLQALVYDCLCRCDVDYRRDLLANIVVCGGSSSIDGVIQRLTYELTELVPSNMKVRVANQTAIERRNAAWIGGSILSICGSFQQLWVSKNEYEEFGGENIAYKRFCH